MSKILVLLPVAAFLAFVAPSVSMRMRLVQIERELSAPPTGDQADTDRRASLRAERDALTGNTNRVASQNPISVVSSRSTSAQVPQVIVAADSRVAERADYEREQRRSVEATRRSIDAANDRHHTYGRTYGTTYLSPSR